VRNFVSITLVLAAATFMAAWLEVESRAQAPEKTSLAGAWTINHDLSDQPPDRSERRSGGDSSGRRGGFGRGGGMRRGGYGGGMGRGSGGPGGDPEEMARMRDAMRDILSPPDHLTITQTESIVVVTGPDGRSTRLSPDGKKVKDDNTKIERKTRWDGANLVSEINGVGRGKMTQTFAVDPEHHQLRISVQMDGGRSNQPRTVTHVYDSDAQ
jgi:hypothetical protein